MVIEIRAVGVADFRGDAELHAGASRDLDRREDPLVGADSPEKREVIAARPRAIDVREPVMDGAHPRRPRHRRALRIGDRDERHPVERVIERPDVGQVEPTVQRRHVRHVLALSHRKVEVVAMEVHDVEVGAPAVNLLEHGEVGRDSVGAAAEPKRARRGRDELRARGRVGAREERHVVSLCHQRLGEVSDDALGSAVELRWNALVEGRDLRDAERTVVVPAHLDRAAQSRRVHAAATSDVPFLNGSGGLRRRWLARRSQSRTADARA